MGGFEHQLNLINVVIRLGELYPAANWISERRLKLDKYSTGLGVRGHMADGLLVFSEEHQVAFEVELTLKSKHRLEGILKAYTAQIAFKEVWYFCAPYVMPTLTKLVAKKPFIKVHDIEEFLL